MDKRELVDLLPFLPDSECPLTNIIKSKWTECKLVCQSIDSVNTFSIVYYGENINYINVSFETINELFDCIVNPKSIGLTKSKGLKRFGSITNKILVNEYKRLQLEYTKELYKN